eukprot:12832628-Alexandrium_andersonii.AAC.1
MQECRAAGCEASPCASEIARMLDFGSPEVSTNGVSPCLLAAGEGVLAHALPRGFPLGKVNRSKMQKRQADGQRFTGSEEPATPRDQTPGLDAER